MFSDTLVQILIAVFGGFVIAWALASYAELKIARYLYRALSIVTELISSQDTFDLRVLPEVVITQGRYKNRVAVVRLNVLSPRYLHYRIHVHLLIHPSLRAGTVPDEPLKFRNPSRTIAWTCSIFEPPPYDEISAALSDLTLEAEALEMESS